ncbi:MAG: Lrp/AsnC family transcriptional regulator [Fimbriimonadaceae bacterium]|nr:Lrp/AsnC family transcriptional regulator [Alphaproteobacteria bacterium]
MQVILDNYDIAILSELQSDARLTILELSKRVHLSPTPCAARLRKLIDSGIITGFHAHLDPARLNRALLVFLQVTLTDTDEATLEEFNHAMRAIPDVLECHMVGGGFDYLVKLRTADMKQFRNFLGHVIGAMEIVRNTHSYFVMEEVKESALLPLNNYKK